MTIGIYSITHRVSGKRYVGKSKNIEKRVVGHKHHLVKGNHFNRHLQYAVVKDGWESFTWEILEQFDVVDEELMKVRELYWMEHFKTTERSHGYNLRKDSSTAMVVHPETRNRFRRIMAGKSNPNYGNRWTQEMKQRMSVLKSEQHQSSEIYTDEWRKNQGLRASNFWKNNPESLEKMKQKLANVSSKYRIFQYSKCGNLIKVWDKIADVIAAFPTYKKHNIYAACSGEKPSIYGYIWRKEPRE